MKDILKLLNLEEGFQIPATIPELFENDPNLSAEDLSPVRKFARNFPNFDMTEVTQDLALGLMFIDAMYHEVLRSNPEIEPRPDQVRGSKLMYISAYFGGNMFGEYPTGSGKSFMYLIFASAVHAVLGHKSAVVTSGISLQEQLESKDLPFIARVYHSLTGEQFTYGLMKGRQNYICNRKLAGLKGAIKAGAQLVGGLNAADVKAYINLIPVPFNGDMSNIPMYASQDIVKALTIKSKKDGGCSTCDMAKECYFNKHQKNAVDAAVRVINYHVLFTEVEKIGKLGYLSGLVNHYIFDEAHEFSSIGRNFSERSFNKYSITSIASRVSEIDNIMDSAMNAKDAAYGLLRNFHFDSMIKETESIFSTEVHRWYEERKSDFYNDAILDPNDGVDISNLNGSLIAIETYLQDALQDKVEALGFESLDQFWAVSLDSGSYQSEGAMFNLISDLIESVASYRSLIKMFELGSTVRRSRPNDVVWIAKDDDGRLALTAKSTDVRSMTSAIFENPNLSSVSVSATLSTNGNFKFYGTEMNIPAQTVSYQIIGPSPFNLREQELWYIPENAKSGSKKDCPEGEYMDVVISNISEILDISKGGMMALFTSVKAMRLAYMEVSRRHPHLKIYMQNDLPRKKLMTLFRDDIHSCLFATRSFFTGVDIKGPSLRVLVLDKLPFENPSDPVIRTLTNRPGGFHNYSIPSMVMVLKQIIGRGVRSTDDKCLIVFMDVRLKESNYAADIRRTFKSSGNYSRRTHSIEDVEEFMKGILDSYSNETLSRGEDLDDDDSIPF